MRKLGYLGQSKEATPALDGMNSTEKLIHDLGGIALFQLGQAFLQFLKLFPHFHEEILKDFVFRIHVGVIFGVRGKKKDRRNPLINNKKIRE